MKIRVMLVSTMLFAWAIWAVMFTQNRLSQTGATFRDSLVVGSVLGLIAGAVTNWMISAVPSYQWRERTPLFDTPVPEQKIGFRMTILGIMLAEVGLLVLERLNAIPPIAGRTPYLLAAMLGLTAGGASVGIGFKPFRQQLVQGRLDADRRSSDTPVVCGRCARAVRLIKRGEVGRLTLGPMRGIDCIGFECSRCGELYCDCEFSQSCPKCSSTVLIPVVLERGPRSAGTLEI